MIRGNVFERKILIMEGGRYPRYMFQGDEGGRDPKGGREGGREGEGRRGIRGREGSSKGGMVGGNRELMFFPSPSPEHVPVPTRQQGWDGRRNTGETPS